MTNDPKRARRVVEKHTFFFLFVVLPKYEVVITPPAYLLGVSRIIDAEICAK